MGLRLVPADEETHQVGRERTWNESRYVDFWDPVDRVGGWLRLGMRPNEEQAEVSVCVYLSGGGAGFSFQRARIEGNSLSAGGQSWAVVDAFAHNAIHFDGPLQVLPDPWMLAEPRGTRPPSETVECSMRIDARSCGLEAVMGADQDHIDRIFLPGQADAHYQHLAWTQGTIKVGNDVHYVRGRGAKDHSWGARNWLAKVYLRWHTCVLEDGSGFMLMRAVGPTKETRSGHVWEDGRLHLVDDFSMRNSYGPSPRHELRSVELVIRSGRRSWSAVGTPVSWLPLRHRHTKPGGRVQVLRIVKSPTDWVWGDGRAGAGAVEYHDRLDAAGVPVGLHD